MKREAPGKQAELFPPIEVCAAESGTFGSCQATGTLPVLPTAVMRCHWLPPPHHRCSRHRYSAKPSHRAIFHSCSISRCGIGSVVADVGFACGIPLSVLPLSTLSASPHCVHSLFVIANSLSSHHYGRHISEAARQQGRLRVCF